VRRPDVRIHRGRLEDDEWIVLHGLLVSSPARIASDLLVDREDPEAVAWVVADTLRGNNEWAGNFAEKLAPRATQLGLRRGDGVAALRSLLNLVDDPQTPLWIEEARSGTTEISPEINNAKSIPKPAV
jgi:hypothetical protein